MGCGSSQSVSVVQVSAPQTKNTSSEQTTQIFEEKKENTKPLSGKKNGSAGTTDSGIMSNKDDMDEVSERRGSLSSNGSGYLDNEYKKVITEKSKKDEILKIENEFVVKNGLELAVMGKSCPPLLSKKEKEMIQLREEQASLEMLKDNGLVQKPLVIKQNYALFEIVEDKLLSKNQSMLTLKSTTETNSLSPLKGPPPRLLQREKTKPSITAEEIDEKLEKANQRKQKQLKIKIQGSSLPNENNSKYSKGPEYDQDVIERQKRLLALRDKIKAKNADVPSSSDTPRTPRSKELVSELDKFRPKTASNFRPDF